MNEETIMKKPVFTIVILIAQFIAVLSAQAQGIVYASNLGQASTGSQSVGSDSWRAEGFITGTNSGGYVLNSVQLQMTTASATPSNFSVLLYDFNASDQRPENSLSVLSGSSNPANPGVYAYAASTITLSPDTLYYIVLAAATPISSGSYNWSVANPTSPGFQFSGGWTFYYLYFNSIDNGLNWNYGRSEFPQMAITATAVPEPSVETLLGLGGLLLLGIGRWKAKVLA
jgi:hypothetical protein